MIRSQSFGGVCLATGRARARAHGRNDRAGEATCVRGRGVGEVGGESGENIEIAVYQRLSWKRISQTINYYERYYKKLGRIPI